MLCLLETFEMQLHFASITGAVKAKCYAEDVQLRDMLSYIVRL